MNKKIKIFYLLSTCGIIIGFLTSALSLITFSAEDYGLFSLYTNYVIQLGILSFGYQDGMLVNYRKKSYEEMLPSLKRDINFGFVFQTFILIASLVVCPLVFGVHYGDRNFAVLMIAIISFYPMTLIGNVRNAYSAMGKFDIVGYFDFFLKAYLLVALLGIWLCRSNVILYMILDTISKFLVAGFLYFKIYRDYKKLGCTEERKVKITIKENFHKGLYILLGNWSFVLVFTLDRTFLQNNPLDLGIYSYSMFVLTTIYQLFIPIKSVIISMINENQSNKKLFYINVNIIVGIFLVVLIYLAIGEPIIDWLLDQVSLLNSGNLVQKLDSIKQGIYFAGIITMGMPFYFVVQLLYMSILTVKNQKRYACVGLVNAAITFCVYLVASILFKDNLLSAIVVGTVINYYLSYLFNGFFIIGPKYSLQTIVYTGLMLGLVAILFYLSNIFLYLGAIAILLIYLVYAYKNKKC